MGFARVRARRAEVGVVVWRQIVTEEREERRRGVGRRQAGVVSQQPIGEGPESAGEGIKAGASRGTEGPQEFGECNNDAAVIRCLRAGAEQSAQLGIDPGKQRRRSDPRQALKLWAPRPDRSWAQGWADGP